MRATSILIYTVGAGVTLLSVFMWRRSIKQGRSGIEPTMGAIGALFSTGVALMLIAVVLAPDS